MKLIRWTKEHKIWAAVTVITLFFLPIIIVHCLFAITAPCEWLIANWKAGEILGYFGAVLSAAATITAVLLTIIYTQKICHSQ